MEDDLGEGLGLFYRLCPRCTRAVPVQSQEHYCINDGEQLIDSCPICKTRIKNPYARHCAGCGLGFASLLEKQPLQTRS